MILKILKLIGTVCCKLVGYIQELSVVCRVAITSSTCSLSLHNLQYIHVQSDSCTQYHYKLNTDNSSSLSSSSLSSAYGIIIRWWQWRRQQRRWYLY